MWPQMILYFKQTSRETGTSWLTLQLNSSQSQFKATNRTVSKSLLLNPEISFRQLLALTTKLIKTIHACMHATIYPFTDTHTFLKVPCKSEDPPVPLLSCLVYNMINPVKRLQVKGAHYRSFLPTETLQHVAKSGKHENTDVKIILHTTFTYPTTQQRPVQVVNNLFTLPSDSTDQH